MSTATAEPPKEEKKVGWSIVKEPQFGPGGKFAPHADQKLYVSAFAAVGDVVEPGWPTRGDLEQGIATQDGKGVLRFMPYLDEKKQAHIVQLRGMKTQEMIAPRPDAEQKELHDARISNIKCGSYYKPTEEIPATDSQVGRKKLESTVYDQKVTLPYDT